MVLIEKLKEVLKNKNFKIDLPSVTEENWETTTTYVREEIDKIKPAGWLITGWAYPEVKDQEANNADENEKTKSTST